MWLRKRRARKFIEAIDEGAVARQFDTEQARLVKAIETLRSADRGRASVDEDFAAGLRDDLVSRYDELCGTEQASQGTSAPSRPGAWIALGAAGAAAAIVAVVLVLVLRGAPAPVVAELTVQEGWARVVDSSGESTGVFGDEAFQIHEGDSIKTPRSSRATIAFADGNIARLDYRSEVGIESYGEDSVNLEHLGGSSYHRVVDGTSYSVNSADVKVKAAGTAFDVRRLGEEFDAYAFESHAEISWTGEEPRILEEGMMAHLEPVDGDLQIETAPIDISTLDLSWVAFNSELDGELDLPMGVLESFGEPADELPAEPGEEPTEEPDQTPPDTTPESQPTGGPQPTPAPEPQPPGPAPEPQPTPPGPQPPEPQPSATLEVTEKMPPIEIRWKTDNLEGADSIAVLRTDGSREPGYPGDVRKVLPYHGYEEKFIDDDTYCQKKYAYRVAFLSAGNVLAYSNTVYFQTEPARLDLEAGQEGGGVRLKWHLVGNIEADSWAVCRSQQNPDPNYPPAPGDKTWVLEFTVPNGTFLDAGVEPRAFYHYRVAALHMGKVIMYSNPVGIEIDSTGAEATGSCGTSPDRGSFSIGPISATRCLPVPSAG